MASTSFFDNDFDAVVEDALKYFHVPGLSIGITYKDKTYTKGYGFANISRKTPVRPETLFFGASTTKSFVAAAFAILIEESAKHQNLDWTTPLSQITPDDFVLSDDWATKHITIQDAFSHLTGYPRYDRAYGEAGQDVKGMVRLLRHLPLAAEPRVQWQYQNIMYSALANALSTLTGMTLEESLRNRIWGPLGMKDSFIAGADDNNASEAKARNTEIATGYRWICGDGNELKYLTDQSEGGKLVEEPNANMTNLAGAGGMITSVLDIVRYLNCLLKKSEPIPKSGHDALRHPRAILPPGANEVLSGQAAVRKGQVIYSLGWFHEVYTCGGHAIDIYYHPGGLHNFGAEMRYMPDLDLGIVILGNTSPGANQAGTHLFYEILSNVLGIAHKDRFDWKKEFVAKEEANIKKMAGMRDKLFGSDTGKIRSLSTTLEEHVGQYRSPGFGQIDVENVNGVLYITPSPRTFSWTAKLMHVSDEWFLVDMIKPFPAVELKSSAEKYPTGREGNLELKARATFKSEPGHGIRWVGIELEPDLAAAEEAKQRRGKGRREDGQRWDWDVEKGMIWFERVDG